MARLSIFDDKVACVCWDYLHGNCDSATNEKIWFAVHDITADKHLTVHFIFEIAYRIGYARSYFADAMSEVTYKKKKKLIRDKIAKLIERSENGKYKKS